MNKTPHHNNRMPHIPLMKFPDLLPNRLSNHRINYITKASRQLRTIRPQTTDLLTKGSNFIAMLQPQSWDVSDEVPNGGGKTRNGPLQLMIPNRRAHRMGRSIRSPILKAEEAKAESRLR